MALVCLLASIAAATTGCTGSRHRPDGRAPSTFSTSDSTRLMSFDLVARERGALRVRVPQEPVATVGTATADVQLELYALERSGQAVNVVFALHNTGTKTVPAPALVEAMDEKPGAVLIDTSNVSVVDPVGLKEYRSYLDGGVDGRCLCSVAWGANTHDVEAGERRYYAVEVAAPPEDVTTVTVLTGIGSVSGATIKG